MSEVEMRDVELVEENSDSDDNTTQAPAAAQPQDDVHETTEARRAAALAAAPLVQYIRCGSKVFIAAVLFIWTLLWIFDLYMALVFPVFFLPTFALSRWVVQHKDHTSYDTTIKMYAFGFLLAAGAIWFIEAIILAISGSIYNEVVEGDCDFCFFTFLACVLAMFVFVEETCKYCLAERGRSKIFNHIHSKSNLIYATSCALGFATSNAFAYVLAYDVESGSPLWVHYVFVIEVMTVFMPLHILTGYLFGMGMVKRDYARLRSLQSQVEAEQHARQRDADEKAAAAEEGKAAPQQGEFHARAELEARVREAVADDAEVCCCEKGYCSMVISPILVRTLALWIVYMIGAVMPNYDGVVLGMVLSIFVSCIFLVYVKQEEKTLPRQFREDVGYLHLPNGFLD